MKLQQSTISPQDIVVLLKIVAFGDKSWFQLDLADSLYLSQSEISKSIARSRYAGLLDDSGKRVSRNALMEFLQYGIAYAFPVRPGSVVRGIPTAHSAPPLNTMIEPGEDYVWPSARGQLRGQAIIPLYKNAERAALQDNQLHELLALVDVVRVGKAREKELAIKELRERLL